MRRFLIGSIGSHDSGDPGKHSTASIAGVAFRRDYPVRTARIRFSNRPAAGFAIDADGSGPR